MYKVPVIYCGSEIMRVSVTAFIANRMCYVRNITHLPVRLRAHAGVFSHCLSSLRQVVVLFLAGAASCAHARAESGLLGGVAPRG